MTTLLLLSHLAFAVPSSGMLPLSVGSEWSWRVVERRGGGPRILFLGSGGTTTPLEDWTFRIQGVKDGVYSAELQRSPLAEGALPSTTAMTLWTDNEGTWFDAGAGKKLAIEANVPPNPITSEKIRCVAHFLGGVGGHCHAKPGGPLDAPAGLVRGVVSQDPDNGAAVTQFLVGIATAGIFIPGNRKARVVAELQSYTPGAPLTPVPAPLYAHWSSGSDLAALASKHGADAESMGAIVAKASPRDTAKVAVQAIALVATADRAPVVRVSLASIGPGRDRLQLIARTHASLAELSPADLESVLLVLAGDDDREQAGRLLSGECPALVAAYDAVDGSFDDDWVAAAKGAIAAHPLNEASVKGLFEELSFGKAKQELLDAVLQQTDGEADKMLYLRAGLSSMSFDKDKLAVFTTHQEWLRAQPESKRSALVERFITFDSKKAEANAILGL